MPQSAGCARAASVLACLTLRWRTSIAIDRYLADLRLQNASPHTLRNYASDLEQFAGYFSPPGQHPPAPAEFTVLQIREWLGDLYDRRLSPVSVRRKLAAVRSLFQFLAKKAAYLRMSRGW